MTGPEHYREAERLISEAKDFQANAASYNSDRLTHNSIAAEQNVALAQVHATLALAAATALVDYRDSNMTEGDQRAWYDAASAQPEHYRRQREAERAEAAEFATEAQS